jgi:hypothetical protein
MSSALEFQNFPLDNLNLKFSNTLPCTLSVDTLPDPSLSLTHNSSISNFVTMEEDCEEPTMSASRTDLEDFGILFRNFTQQMSTHMNLLQEHLRSTVEQTAKAQVHFKQEIREELDELHALVSTNSSPPIQQPVVGSSAPPISNVPASSIPISALDTNLSPQDLQNKMMLMLTESFSKLSTVLVETKTQDVKSEWPKFSGDAKKFRSWYLSIMALISIPPWNEFYDAQHNDVVITTPNTSLNGKLYAKLISVLEGQALQDMILRSHLRANGVLLLRELVHTYKPTNVPEVLAAKAGEFWSRTKRMSNESVDTYYNRFKELLDELDQADNKISTKSAMRHFIFTLGTEFEAIQNNYTIGNLPTEWTTDQWPVLLVLCRNYYNSVNPKGLLSNQKDSSTDSHTKRMAQLKKVKEWFLSPITYCKEISQEQKKYPDQCIFHLSKSHQTADCNLKRECDRILLAQKKNGSPQGRSTSNSSSQEGQPTASGHLRLITEDEFVDAEMHAVSAIDIDDVADKDTNECDLIYFARLSNHYLRLVKNNVPEQAPPRHPRSFPVIADSGANHHMFKDREYFITLQPSSGDVYLGDGKTALSIQGVGTVQCKIGSNILTLQNVRYIPTLSGSIYSLFQHVQSPGHRLESSYENGLHIIFPSFKTKAIIGRHDIYLDTEPLLSTTNSESSSSQQEIPLVCRDITDFQQDVKVETDRLDNILHDLRRYFMDVKTKRQLGLKVPAGFCRQSQHIIDTRLNTPPRHSDQNSDIIQSFSSLPHDDTSVTSVDTPLHSDCTSTIEHFSSSKPSTSSTPDFIPIIRSVDKPSSSLPDNVTMTEDHLRASVGFRRIDVMKKHLKTLYQPTILLDNTPADAILDPGFFASLKKKNRILLQYRDQKSLGMLYILTLYLALTYLLVIYTMV